MRSRFALGAIAGLAAIGLALTGCSSSGGDAKPSSTSTTVDGKGRTLSVYVGASGLYPQQQKEWFAQLQAQFKKETGADLAFDTFASSNDELTKIQTSVVSGQGPDVYALGTTFTPTAYATGAFVTLTDADWAKVGGRDRFVPAALGMSGPDSKNQIGVPLAQRPFVMAYNKDLLKAAGIDKPATTWDDFASQAKKLTTGDTYGVAAGYADNYDPWKFIWAMSVQAGNPILDLKSGKARLDDPTTEKAYQTYFGWLTEQKAVDPAAVGWKNPQAVAAFGAGKAAYLPMVSASSIEALDASAVAGKYAYALMPTVAPGKTSNPSSGKPAASIVSGDNIVVAKYSKNQDLAFAYINMVTRADMQTKEFSLLGDLPSNAQAAADLQKAKPIIAPIVDAIGKSVATPFSGAWGDTQLALTNVVVQSIPNLSNGSVSSSELSQLLKTAQSTAQSSLYKAKK
ncbi:MAG: extracellular solute-binding protein [Actinobacteria bacterium]|nr:extracellular solute-binding protein [Actinomycetota bacterium]